MGFRFKFGLNEIGVVPRHLVDGLEFGISLLVFIVCIHGH